MNQFLPAIDAIRVQAGFLTLEETLRLGEQGNVILDPFSVLISRGISLGGGNTFYPQTTLETRQSATIHCGSGNTFYSGTLLLATTGQICIGNDNLFGPGGLSMKLTDGNGDLQIGSRGRYQNGAQLLGGNTLGDGCQVLGAIAVLNCQLESGGNYHHAEPDERGAVLKGMGTARHLRLRQGQVINGLGDFSAAPIESQSKYHPKVGR